MKLYAFPDIHGDYDRLCELLTEYSIINANLDWIAGDSKLIFLGDLTDRHPRGIDVIEFVMKLQDQAAESGGEVVALIGNHDALILSMAYINRDLYYNRDCVGCFIYNGGYYEEAEIIADNDKIFNWMLSRPMIYKHNNMIFQHADSCSYYKSMGNTIEKINLLCREMLKSGQGAWEIFYEMTDCRQWDSQFFDNEDTLGIHIDSYLDQFGAEKIVHGHTRFIGTTVEGPMWYYDNKICNIDGSLSMGYQLDPYRGCILEVNIDTDNS